MIAFLAGGVILAVAASAIHEIEEFETVPGLTVGKDDVGTGATSDTAHDLEDRFLYKHLSTRVIHQ